MIEFTIANLGSMFRCSCGCFKFYQGNKANIAICKDCKKNYLMSNTIH